MLFTLICVVLLRNKTTTSSSSDVSDNQTLANEPLNLDQEVEENQDIPKESWNKKKKTKTVSDNGLHFKHQKNFKKNMQKAKPMRRDPSDEGPSLLRRKPVKPSNCKLHFQLSLRSKS